MCLRREIQTVFITSDCFENKLSLHLTKLSKSTVIFFGLIPFVLRFEMLILWVQSSHTWNTILCRRLCCFVVSLSHVKWKCSFKSVFIFNDTKLVIADKYNTFGKFQHKMIIMTVAPRLITFTCTLFIIQYIFKFNEIVEYQSISLIDLHANWNN